MHHHRSRCAFTLIEMSIVLLIVGGIMAMTLTLGREWLAKEQFKTTKMNMELIQKALYNYAKTSGRLPCPGQLDMTESDPNFGLESWEVGDAVGDCMAGAPIDASYGVGDVVFGSVPVKTLGLSEGLARDQWGRMLVYHVDQSATMDNVFFKTSPNYEPPQSNETGEIIIQGAGGSVRTNHAIYAILSHGRNGHGGRNSAGVRINAGSTDAGEQENCDCNNTAASTGDDSTLVQMLQHKTFDDIVMYVERHHLGY